MDGGDLSNDDDWEATTVTVDWNAPTAVETVPSAAKLMEKFDRYVVSHSQAKEALVATLRLHLMRDDVVTDPPRVLLMGPRGVGKTALADTLLDLTDLPSLRIDFGELAAVGRADVMRMISMLGPDDEPDSPWGILFLDGLEHLAGTPLASVPTFDGFAVQADLLDVLGDRQLLICGAVAIEEPLKQTASQQDLRNILEATVPLMKELAASFDLLLPIDRLSAAQIAKSFSLSRSPFARARRVIASLGGSFHVEPKVVEALARTCSLSPIGGWAANRVIDRLLEQVLRAPDPAQAWRLGHQ